MSGRWPEIAADDSRDKFEQRRRDLVGYSQIFPSQHQRKALRRPLSKSIVVGWILPAARNSRFPRLRVWSLAH
jgi:hypothetical protein